MAAALQTEELLTGAPVRERFQPGVGEMAQAARPARAAGPAALAAALLHFVKVSGSYQPGLFHGSAVLDRPPTTNDLEQAFGRVRHPERRASGRQKASTTLVGRGAARLVAALATPLEELSPAELAPRDLGPWQKKRGEQLRRRRRRRAQQARCRHDPEAFLRQLEDLLSQSRLPS
jgi:hypothetical protein